MGAFAAAAHNSSVANPGIFAMTETSLFLTLATIGAINTHSCISYSLHGHGFLHEWLIRLIREGREIRPKAIAKSVSVDLLSGTYERRSPHK
jgi:hypothetical protein